MELLDQNTHGPGRKIIMTLSSICGKVDPWATHTCRALPSMALNNSIIQDSSTAWTVRIVSRLCRSIMLMLRTERLCPFGVQWFILNIQMVLTSLKLKFSVILELFRSCLLGKRAAQGVVKRTKKNIHEFQRDTYQLGILTLNLGHINRVPYIGGSSRFPKWVRTDTKYRVLPHLVFRNAAHIVCLCEASDEYGGIAIHREIAKEYGMIGMVVHPAISSQSL